MRAPSPPPAPDPVATSRAQTQSNVATAGANSTLNLVDQITPQGNLTHQQIGTVAMPDGFGGTINVPRFQATQTLSPAQQQLFNQNQSTELAMSRIAGEQTNRIGSVLSSPVDLNNEATEARLFDLGRRRLDPMFAEQDEALRTRLANQGIRAGSQAYDAETRRFGETRNDAFNQLLLQGRGQAVQEALAERSHPINEITALLSGSQVSQPNFIQAPTSPVNMVDHSGNVNNAYAGQLSAYRERMGAHNAMMGGIFGTVNNIARIGLPMMMSDRRLKSNIVRVGEHPLGIGVYEYDIFGRRERGVMAQELVEVRPEAVATHELGFMMVDYEMIGGRP
jgi:hypothetical protein